jgi:hypothetical protein
LTVAGCSFQAFTYAAAIISESMDPVTLKLQACSLQGNPHQPAMDVAAGALLVANLTADSSSRIAVGDVVTVYSNDKSLPVLGRSGELRHVHPLEGSWELCASFDEPLQEVQEEVCGVVLVRLWPAVEAVSCRISCSIDLLIGLGLQA